MNKYKRKENRTGRDGEEGGGGKDGEGGGGVVIIEKKSLEGFLSSL